MTKTQANLVLPVGVRPRGGDGTLGWSGAFWKLGEAGVGLSRDRVWGRVDEEWGEVDGELCGGRVLGDSVGWELCGELGECRMWSGVGGGLGGYMLSSRLIHPDEVGHNVHDVNAITVGYNRVS